jgi:Uma2 family endonuclease
MSTIPFSQMTSKQYLEFERASPVKHEFFAGALRAMAGASEAHNLIASNMIRGLGNALSDRECRVYPGDMRIRIPRTGYYFYPDVSVVCGDPEFDDAERDVLLNPLVVIEVLSSSTERYDRGEKFRRYRRIPSLRDYVLISQELALVELHSRRDFNRWELTEVEGVEGTVELPALQTALPLAEIYRQVTFESGSSSSTGEARE